MACAFQVSREHLDVRGEPLDGGKLYCYKYGTQEHKVTYSDVDMTSANPWPIILNARGGANVYWDGTPVRFELYARDSGSGEDYFVNSWDKVKGSDGAITEIEHDETLTGSGTETSPLGVDTDVIPTKEYVDDTFATKDELSGHTGDTNNPHQVTAAQVDAYTKTEVEDRLTEERENYGIMTKYEATNTLHFYRPKSVPNPDYYLPETHFDGTSAEQVIHTGYSLISKDTTHGYEYLQQWTLFVNMPWNGCTTSAQTLVDCRGLGTHDNYLQNITGGCCYTQDIHRNCPCVLYWTKYESAWYRSYVYLDPETAGHTIVTQGKMALRRSNADSMIKYTLNGIDWFDTDVEVTNLEGSNTRYELCFGGRGDSTYPYPGVGTLTARIWKQPLEDISKLF